MDVNNNDKQSKNFLVAVVLSGIVLIGWNYLFPPPVYTPKQEVVAENKSEGIEKSIGVSQNRAEGNEAVVPSDVKIFELSNELASVKISSTLEILEYSFDNTKRILTNVFPDLKAGLSILVDGEVVDNFSVEQIGSRELSLAAGTVNGIVRLNDEGQIELSFSSQNKLQFIGNIESKEESKDQRINNFVVYTNELSTYAVGDDEFEIKDANIGWYGIDYDYHLLGFVTEKNLFHVKGKGNTLKVANLNQLSTLNFKVVYLKKNYDDLVNLGDNLKNAVDFGIWSVIALPMLRGLQFFYGVLNNWGLAIIVLTILIRTVMFPLQHSSFKSMKKMQVLQPDLKKIREKYKEDPQKMQAETMALFKKNKANPVGGCLPLMLQMPIFFAFYRMLYNSVELVDAPFYFWISDLSERDPFYVLPVLLGITMYFNMKITPQTTADPAQQKVMKLMPVLFSAFLFTLPSALNLYILVSTIVGMLQQIFVFKRTKA